MRYAVLLWPHANARYQEAIVPLAKKELLLTLNAILGEQTEAFSCECTTDLGVRALVFTCPALEEEAIFLLRAHSDLYMLCEYTDDGLLRPIAGPAAAALGEDLSAILKYKGKTNERFTRKMLRMAYLQCQCKPSGSERIRVLDPMCGKGTALFEAVNMGFDAFGLDVDSAALNEAGQFYKKYLEYHRVKHTQKQTSMTVSAGKGAPVRSIAAQNQGEIRFACADASMAAKVYGKGKAHIIVADLPYGVQHAPAGGQKMPTLRGLVEHALPGCVDTLRKGGVIALSFNTNTLPAKDVAAAMEACELDVLKGEAFEGLAHWVEQAVTRDIVFAIRK